MPSPHFMTIKAVNRNVVLKAIMDASAQPRHWGRLPDRAKRDAAWEEIKRLDGAHQLMAHDDSSVRYYPSSGVLAWEGRDLELAELIRDAARAVPYGFNRR